jgi:hypothetical protein
MATKPLRSIHWFVLDMPFTMADWPNVMQIVAGETAHNTPKPRELRQWTQPTAAEVRAALKDRVNLFPDLEPTAATLLMICALLDDEQTEPNKEN